MNKHHECIRGFYIHSEAWYASQALGKGTLGVGTVDDIMIGMYHPEGGTTGEFRVKWIELGGRAIPKLGAFNNSWSALAQFPDLLHWMSSVDGRCITPKEFAEALRSMGIKDLTQREQPTRPIPTLVDIQDALPL